MIDVAAEPMSRHDSRTPKILPILLTALLTGAASLEPWGQVTAQTPPQLTTEQTAALAEAARLNQQLVQLYQQGKYAEAVPLAERALATRKRVLGDRHPDVATSLNNLAFLYGRQGRYSEAEPLYQQALELNQQLLGDRHPAVATSLNNLAFLYESQGRFAEAEPLYQQALELRRQILGDRHPDVATSLNNLALLYGRQGRYSEAEPLYQQALELLKQLLGDRHPDVATSLNNLAGLYESQGRYSEAEPLYQQALELNQQLLGDRHPDVATSLNNLAGLYESQGRYSEAEPLYQQALELLKQLLGDRHPLVASSLNNLAGLYESQGRYSEAEPLYQQALELRRQILGERHPDVATSLNNLAFLYGRQGRYSEAEPLYQQALELNQQLLGDRHPDVATSLNNLAFLYGRQGRYSEAEPLYQQALELRRQLLGDRHPDVASSLNNLAFLYESQGRYSEAEPLYQQALELRRQILGDRHPNVATSLNNLALLYGKQGRYSEAEPLFQQALELRKQLLGVRHPDVASSLNNLAFLYERQGRYSEAEPLYQQALELRRQLLGERHPDVAQSLNNLAGLYERQGRYSEATTLLTQGLNIEENHLTTNLAIGAEAQKRDYIARLQGTTDATISLHLQRASTNPDVARLALTTALRRKGRILDALSDNLNRLRQNLTPADQEKLDQLTATRTQLATLYYGGLGDRTPEQYRTEINTLQQQATRLEADLNTRSAEFRSETQPITLEAVQQQIPADAALVELIRYEPFNPKAKPGERWGKPRYAAYTLTVSGTIQAVDLGEAAPIDQLADDFRHALRNRESSVKPIARQLDAVLMQPIRQKLGNTRTLLISPDSQLNLIPFAALVDEQNRYLVETYAINYLTSGRDLLRLQTSIANRQPPVLIANPDYANPGNPQAVAQLRRGNPVAIAPSPSSPSSLTRSTSQRSTDLTRLTFGPLPGTAAEAEAIASLLHKVQNAPKLPNVILLTGTQATENALKQVQSPQILHIATHGFFLEDIPLVAPGTRGRGSLLRSDILPEVEAGFRPPTRPGNTENALLRSGLALAGFNPRQSGVEDGVLTALEAAGLNLRGTQLVVLSACETGIGDVANGEGVYGLRRAFVMAGAESQLISLWKVDDRGTKDLMVSYYDKLVANAGRRESLRQTQLEFLNSSRYRHPYYWAAFIPSGDWRSMGK